MSTSPISPLQDKAILVWEEQSRNIEFPKNREVIEIPSVEKGPVKVNNDTPSESGAAVALSKLADSLITYSKATINNTTFYTQFI